MLSTEFSSYFGFCFMSYSIQAGLQRYRKGCGDAKESDMHSWVEAAAGLYKHSPCGRNDQPVIGHCLPRIPLFGQDSNNHMDLSSPGHLNK